MAENPAAVENTLFVLRYAIGTQPMIAQTLLEFAMKVSPLDIVNVVEHESSFIVITE